MVIPKHFFISERIEQRKPLSSNAKRAGWIGCNILLDEIPSEGKIYIVKNQKEIDKKYVIENLHKTKFLAYYDFKERGWLIDTMKCINKILDNTFTLDEIYKFENELKFKHPNNNFIKDKLRQQLQLLRDKGLIEFVSRGVYKKI